MKFRFIAMEKAHHSLELLCRCLRVTRSGFYAWRYRPESPRAKRDRHLKVLVRASFTASKQRPFYNTRRRHSTLDYVSPAEYERRFWSARNEQCA